MTIVAHPVFGEFLEALTKSCHLEASDGRLQFIKRVDQRSSTRRPVAQSFLQGAILRHRSIFTREKYEAAAKEG
jgi:hypothetical protein